MALSEDGDKFSSYSDIFISEYPIFIQTQRYQFGTTFYIA